MKMEYRAEILRGWPADGARERSELVKQGSVLVNGDFVEMQVDGTVDKVGGSNTKRAGLVIRGNGDSSAAANAKGRFKTPQTAKTVTAITWSGCFLTITVAGHGYVVGNVVVIAGTTTTACNGTYIIASVPSANTFTVPLASNPGAITLGSPTATLQSATNNSGKAVVLWGNYIAKVDSTAYTAGAYVPGSPVTANAGKIALANGTTDPELGYVLRVQGVSGTETAHLIVVAY